MGDRRSLYTSLVYMKQLICSGSSSNPCSDTYMGASAFSEIETANMRDWITAHKVSLQPLSAKFA